MTDQEPTFTKADAALLTLVSRSIADGSHLLLGNGLVPEALSNIAERINQAVAIESAPVVSRTRT